MIDDIEKLLQYYRFTEEDKEIFKNIIFPVINHEEFIRRYNREVYPHHGYVSLGRHLICDAIITYKKCKIKKKVNYKTAVLIALFHDLYELPWQNSSIKKRKKVNYHGFIHPIEAVINAATWFPEYFVGNDLDVLVDGIIHHMYPFPVRAINNINDLELNNLEKYKKLNLDVKKSILKSTNRFKFKNLSFCKSKYKEGRIVSSADKYISIGGELNSFSSVLACITGINKNL